MTINSEESTYDSTLSLESIIRSILISRARDGATISEIREDYYNHFGENFPDNGNILQMLFRVKGITCTSNSNGTLIFNIANSDHSQHILDMVRNQKQTTLRYKPSANSRASSYSSLSGASRDKDEHLCYFKDNYDYLYKRPNYDRNISNSTPNSSLLPNKRENYAHLYNYQLLGDDFFLSMAKMELNCKFRPGHKILQSGLCISGQTIADATKRVIEAPYINPRIIVNIGSVDILHEHDLMDIEHDFMNLMEAFHSRSIYPIITTLVPLANYGHRAKVKKNLEKFNDFLRRHTCWNVIDLWPCMVNQYNQTLYECYQNEARYVTGSNKPHVFWNKIGRQRILKLIKAQLSEI